MNFGHQKCGVTSKFTPPNKRDLAVNVLARCFEVCKNTIQKVMAILLSKITDDGNGNLSLLRDTCLQFLLGHFDRLLQGMRL